jgi:hypothetical protein
LQLAINPIIAFKIRLSGAYPSRKEAADALPALDTTSSKNRLLFYTEPEALEIKQKQLQQRNQIGY